jgi:hypothetical protein
MQKQIIYYFFMPPRYGVHGALKNVKAKNIFMIFLMQI